MIGARARAILVVLAVAACAPAPPPQRLDAPAALVPAQPIFDQGPPAPLPPQRSNAEIAYDFLELGFFMESGREIPFFSRFEASIFVIARNPPHAQALHELRQLLARLRTGAGIAIALASSATAPAANRMTIDFVPRRVMASVVPAAACFVVPNVDSWEEFVANRRNPALDWTQVVVRTRVAVFVPADTTPQEIRDCLHEEVAQALGPLNDLYRIPESVFNDDNFQATLTGFDMLVLRAWYAPDLRPGMTRDEVAARLPVVLNRLNPAGRRLPGPLPGPTPRAWTETVDRALSGAEGHFVRREAARRALALAHAEGWQDARLALSLLLWARLSAREEGEAALAALVQAGELYRRLPGGEVHAAHIDMLLAVQALASGHYGAVLDLTARALPYARRTHNAALEAMLTFLRAEALAQLGRSAEAEALRQALRPAALYGLGSEEAVAARLTEIGRLPGTALRLAQR